MVRKSNGPTINYTKTEEGIIATGQRAKERKDLICQNDTCQKANQSLMFKMTMKAKALPKN